MLRWPQDHFDSNDPFFQYGLFLTSLGILPVAIQQLMV